MNKVLIVGLLMLIIQGCTRPLPQITAVDMQQWKADNHGCKGYRQSTAEALLQQKEKLLGLSENQILKLLGKPDAAELYKRNQKFYYYALAADSTCDHSAAHSQIMALRFNATGLVKEITLE